MRTARDNLLIGLLALVALCGLGGACGREDPPPAQNSEKPPTIASVSPAGTELLLGLGVGDRLVAVSDFDTDPRVATLPNVGGFMTFDWETLAQVDPDVLVVQVGRTSLPPGAIDRADQLGVEWLSIEIRTLADIRRSVGELAKAVDLDDAAAVARFDAELGDAVPPPADPPAVLVLLSSDLTFAAGRGNYLDDLITHVGGRNAIGSEFDDWPTLDREALASLTPDAAVLILPDATAAQLAEAEAAWRSLGDDWPIAWSDVTVVTASHAMVPGWRVTELADVLRTAAADRRGAADDDS
jgi:ABC-type Fe3+-hydroxamate transport system substrate-binding protein